MFPLLLRSLLLLLRPLPLLPSRIHLAQSRFVAVRDAERREMTFDDMKRADPTRIHEQLVVTVDGQLFYSMLDALPYLVDYPYECTEQTMNRFVARSASGNARRVAAPPNHRVLQSPDLLNF